MDYSDALFSDNIKRIAVFSDIHGNRQALNAILNDINQKDIKEVVFNGDQITSSAHSEDVVKRIKELGIPCTRGNHERYLHELYDPNDETQTLETFRLPRFRSQGRASRQRSNLRQMEEKSTSWCLLGPKSVTQPERSSRT